MKQNEKMLIEKLETMLQKRTMVEKLKEQPIYEDELNTLGYDVLLQNNNIIDDYRKQGLIVQRPKPSLKDFTNSADGYVVKQSTISQMTADEFRQARQANLFFDNKLSIYDDLGGEEVVHYNFKLKQPNGTFVDRSTGGLNMTRVRFVDLDEFESQTRDVQIKQAQLNYDEAQNEIQALLNNKESIAEGNFEQYHNRSKSVFV